MDKTIRIIVVAILSLAMASCAGKQSDSQEGTGGEIVEITPSFTDAVHQYDELHSLSEEDARLEERRIQEENKPTVREVIIEYTTQHGKVNSVKASHGYSLTTYDEDILSDIITIPQGKKWIFKGINENSGARILTYIYNGGALRRDMRFEVSTNTRDKYQFYGGEKIRVAINTFRSDTHMDSAKIVFTFIEKPEYD